MQARPTTVLESSSLPTPPVSDVYTANLASTQQKDGSLHSVTLAQVFHRDDLFPVPEESMLRTPGAIAGQGGAISEKQAREKGRMVQVRDQMAQLAAENGLKVSASIAESLLPTPALGHIRNYDEPVEDYLARRKKMEDGEYKGMPGVSLGVALRMEMMPTSKALDGVKGNLKTSQQRRDAGHFVDLTNVAIDLAQEETKLSWGKFEPAIRRWEAVLGREAPAPTLPDGKEGNHRLNSRFTEWMMGLPDGWITDTGLTRNDELKACGNGVVPQQAEYALRILLQDIKLE